MQLAIITIGSRGDVQPYVALGLGLQAAGYRVKLITHYTFRDFVTSRGLDFFPLPIDPQQLLGSELGQAWLETGTNPLTFFRRVGDIAERYREESLAAIDQSMVGVEGLLYSAVSIFGFHLGQARRIPVVAAPLQPMTRTRAFPSILSPACLRLGGSYNWLTHFLVDHVLWLAARSFINPWRVDQLDLPPIGWRGPYAAMRRQKLPYICGFSPSVLPRPADWLPEQHVAGYWFLDRPADWLPPANLVDFLAAGPPPVCVGFGSMVGRDPAQLNDLTLQAIRLSGQRAVLSSGWSGLGEADLPETIFKVDDIPHDWLFPQMAAVIHHGGAGTTAAGLRAGKPTLICPFFADQPFWGQRVARLGAGLPPLPQNTLTAEALADGIRRVATDAKLKAGAAGLGTNVRAEDGVRRAVNLVRRLMGPPR